MSEKRRKKHYDGPGRKERGEREKENYRQTITGMDKDRAKACIPGIKER